VVVIIGEEIDIDEMKHTPETIAFPVYAKIALIFVSLFAFVYTMLITQDIAIPIIYACILAVLLNPVINFFVRFKINRMLAIVITVAFALIFIIFVFYLIFSQFAQFTESFPIMKEKFLAGNEELINWVSKQTKIDEFRIQEYLTKTKDAQIEQYAVGENFLKIGQVVMTIILLPVYTVMILYYKNLIINFIRSLFQFHNYLAVSEVLENTKKIIQTYIVGLFIETIIVAVLNSIGLLIIGMEYAILLGSLGAILNVIPYVGAIIAATIFMVIALLTMSPIYMLYVLIMYALIQFVDNNFLLPKIVAARVRINALASIIVVIIGGTIWGVPGMFLAIPLTAIIKVIFDHVDSLKPWGVLLGDIVPTMSKFSLGKNR
jgi:predicted PurR-regulated permease PerM